MYQRILLPTDGSELSLEAAKHGIQLAKKLGSSVVAFFAAPGYPLMVYGDAMVVDPISPQEYAKEAAQEAERYTQQITLYAREQGVPCESYHTVQDNPWEAIIAAADTQRCDLIVMASHGRKGLSGVLLGSETQKVLTHCKKPVLVFRK